MRLPTTLTYREKKKQKNRVRRRVVLYGGPLRFRTYRMAHKRTNHVPNGKRRLQVSNLNLAKYLTPLLIMCFEINGNGNGLLDGWWGGHADYLTL